MTAEILSFETGRPAEVPDGEAALVVDVEGYEGPLDLLLTLARYFGPIALVIALFPFTFTHLTKPETELLSTFVGGAIYGWFAWRTGSILWGAAAHVYIVTLLIVASGG